MSCNNTPDDGDAAANGGSEYDRIGSPKGEFILALREFWADCGIPPYRVIARVSLDLRERYHLPEEQKRLPSLSAAAISEILAGKRRGMPSSGWVASFVLACQYQSVRAGRRRRDQGLAILSHWSAIYAAHAPAGPGPLPAWHLTGEQRAFLDSHGPYSQILIARAEQGHPHARYRVALLMATDPDRTDQAAIVLTEVAGTGHPLALDLLEILARSKRAAGTKDAHDQPGSTAARDAGRLAHQLADEARVRGSEDEASAFCRAAARAGILEAAIDLAQTLLTTTDPEAAQWLRDAAADPPTGRHRAAPA